jgi:hypothetical protein
VAHKQPTLVRDEYQPPAVVEFDGGFASSASPNRGRDCAAVAAAARFDFSECSLWNWRNSSGAPYIPA